ncbi:MAG: discoidin domain-containing protein, partial [Lentisphaeria bacterium]
MGKLVSFEQKPNYPHCMDNGDAYDLTDGKYLQHDGVKMWMQPGSVGWRSYATVSWSIDLGEMLPLGELRYHTGAGLHGARWPLALYVLVSRDGQNFAFAGELIKENYSRLPEYNTGLYNLWLKLSLNVEARYVSFVVKCEGMFHFVDEIELLRG